MVFLIHTELRCTVNRTSNTKRFAYTSFVHPILEYGAARWDPCREGQINALDRIQKKDAEFTDHTKDYDRETLAQRRTIARLFALFKAYSGERAWNVIRDTLRRAYCLSRVDNVRKISDRKQRTDIWEYSFVNRSIKNWNELPAEVLGTFNLERELGKQL